METKRVRVSQLTHTVLVLLPVELGVSARAREAAPPNMWAGAAWSREVREDKGYMSIMCRVHL